MSSTLNLDRPRRLKYTLAAARQFRAVAKIPIHKVRDLDADGAIILLADTEIFTWTVWAGLLHEEPKLTFEKTEELLQAYVDKGGKFADVLESMMDAFNESGMFGLRIKKATEDAAPEAVQAPNG